MFSQTVSQKHDHSVTREVTTSGWCDNSVRQYSDNTWAGNKLFRFKSNLTRLNSIFGQGGNYQYHFYWNLPICITPYWTMKVNWNLCVSKNVGEKCIGAWTFLKIYKVSRNEENYNVSPENYWYIKTLNVIFNKYHHEHFIWLSQLDTMRLK